MLNGPARHSVGGFVSLEYTHSHMTRCRGLLLRITLLSVCFVDANLIAQSSDDTVQRYAEQGQRALAQGHYPEAERAFEKLRTLQPGVAEIHANLGLIYFEERKYDQAVKALRQALKLKPALERSETLLAMSLAESGRFEEALPGLEKGFRRSPDPDAKRLCGLELQRAYSSLKRDSKAAEVAMELNRLYPDDPEVLYQTGKIYGNLAFLTMERLAQVAPTSVWRHLAAAEAHESQGSYSQAIQEYSEVLRLDANRRGVHYRIGRSLMGRYWQRQSADDLSAAQQEFEKELQVDPENASAAYELGEMHRKSKQIDEAQRYFDQALEHYPDFAEAQLGLAAVLMAKNQPAEALPHAQRAAAVDPENEVCWFRLAQIQRELHNPAEQEKALVEYRRLHLIRNRQKEVETVLTPGEVTKQEVEPGSSQ
jgi:tetratricopeptide (TPR) repeat protein